MQFSEYLIKNKYYYKKTNELGEVRYYFRDDAENAVKELIGTKMWFRTPGGRPCEIVIKAKYSRTDDDLAYYLVWDSGNIGCLSIYINNRFEFKTTNKKPRCFSPSCGKIFSSKSECVTDYINYLTERLKDKEKSVEKLLKEIGEIDELIDKYSLEI